MTMLPVRPICVRQLHTQVAHENWVWKLRAYWKAYRASIESSNQFSCSHYSCEKLRVIGGNRTGSRELKHSLQNVWKMGRTIRIHKKLGVAKRSCKISQFVFMGTLRGTWDMVRQSGESRWKALQLFYNRLWIKQFGIIAPGCSIAWLVHSLLMKHFALECTYMPPPCFPTMIDVWITPPAL